MRAESQEMKIEKFAVQIYPALQLYKFWRQLCLSFKLGSIVFLGVLRQGVGNLMKA